MNAMSLSTFQATGQECADIGAAIGDIGMEGRRGYVYAESLYIETDATHATLTLGSQGWHVPLALLEDLEAILYQWAISEDYFTDMEPEQIAGTAAAAAIVEWCNVNGRAAAMREAIKRNHARPAGICYLQDVCDVAHFLLDENDDIDVAADAYAIARAELELMVENLK